MGIKLEKSFESSLTKYFERRKDLDFKNNKDYCYCFSYKEMQIILYRIRRAGYYIIAKLPENVQMDEDVRNLDLAYTIVCDEIDSILRRYYGGVKASDFDIDAWVINLDRVLKLAKETPAPKPVIYFNTLDDGYYAYRWEKNYGNYFKSLSCLYDISSENISKFNVKRLTMEDQYIL